MLSRRSMLTSAAGALALVAAPKCGPTNPPMVASPPLGVQTISVWRDLSFGSPPPRDVLTHDILRAAVRQLHENGVPGPYMLHHRRLVSLAGDIETDEHYKARVFWAKARPALRWRPRVFTAAS